GLYNLLHCHWEPRVVLGADSTRLASEWESHWVDCPSFTEEMMALDTTTYLPDCILTKLDRASMAVSLEARVPLLDHRIVEFAWTLPLEFKRRDGEAKWPLRQILKRYLPEAQWNRPKRGFGV